MNVLHTLCTTVVSYICSTAVRKIKRGLFTACRQLAGTCTASMCVHTVLSVSTGHDVHDLVTA